MWQTLKDLAIQILSWVAGVLYEAQAAEADKAREEANELRRQRDIADRPNKPINDLLDEMRDRKF